MEDYKVSICKTKNKFIIKFEINQFITNHQNYEFNNIVKPHWLGKEAFHSSHRANLLRKDFEYYSQFNWTENPESPYVWHDVENQWYEQHVGTGQRVYL